MIYAKLHQFNGDQVCIVSQDTQPDSSWWPYEVPDASWLVIQGGMIVSRQPGIEGARQDKLAEINAKCEELMAQVRAKYPDSEIMSWPKQEQEARAYAAATNSDCPLLANLAHSRGIDIDILANRIILKADEYAIVSGSIIGTRQRLEDQLNALGPEATIEDFQAIVWPSE